MKEKDQNNFIDKSLESDRIVGNTPEEIKASELALFLKGNQPQINEGLKSRQERLIRQPLLANESQKESFFARIRDSFPSSTSVLRPAPLVVGTLALLTAFQLANTPNPTPTFNSASPQVARTAPAVPIPGAELDQVAPSSQNKILSEDGGVSDSMIIEPPPYPGTTDQGLNREKRLTDKSALLTISLDENEFSAFNERLVGVVKGAGGLILQSNISRTEEDKISGFYEIKVPVDKLDITLASLSSLGKVQSITNSQIDVTNQDVSLAQRRKEVVRQINDMREQIEKASKQDRVYLEDQLRYLISERRSLEGSREEINKRVQWAAISLTLVSEDQQPKGELALAIDRAGDQLIKILAAFLSAVAIALPFLFLGLIMMFFYRRWRH